MEPDEDEDPTRLCAKCEVRPRYSKHGCCRNCLQCAGRQAIKCIRRRKKEHPTSTPEQQREARRVQRKAQRQRANAKRIGAKPRPPRTGALNV
jgi:hypothetical protein